MAILSWRTKKALDPIPATLRTDAILYPAGAGYPDTPPESALILGDNLAVMSALLPHYEGRINLIYADPPFFTNRQLPGHGLGAAKIRASPRNGSWRKATPMIGETWMLTWICFIPVSS